MRVLSDFRALRREVNPYQTQVANPRRSLTRSASALPSIDTGGAYRPETVVDHSTTTALSSTAAGPAASRSRRPRRSRTCRAGPRRAAERLELRPRSSVAVPTGTSPSYLLRRLSPCPCIFWATIQVVCFSPTISPSRAGAALTGAHLRSPR